VVVGGIGRDGLTRATRLTRLGGIETSQEGVRWVWTPRNSIRSTGPSVRSDVLVLTYDGPYTSALLFILCWRRVANECHYRAIYTPSRWSHPLALLIHPRFCRNKSPYDQHTRIKRNQQRHQRLNSLCLRQQPRRKRNQRRPNRSYPISATITRVNTKSNDKPNDADV
jgi:hypothetical protein